MLTAERLLCTRHRAGFSSATPVALKLDSGPSAVAVDKRLPLSRPPSPYPIVLDF